MNKILLLDNQGDQPIYASMNKLSDHSDLTYCQTLNEAIYKATRTAHDIVITGNLAGHQNYRPFLRLIKAISPNAPILLIANYDSIHSQMADLEPLVDEVIHEPFNNDHIVHAICRYLPGRTETTALAS